LRLISVFLMEYDEAWQTGIIFTSLGRTLHFNTIRMYNVQ
jgi:hypothetical protein